MKINGELTKDKPKEIIKQQGLLKEVKNTIFCEIEKSRIFTNLITYMELLEKDPKALDEFKYTTWID